MYRDDLAALRARVETLERERDEARCRESAEFVSAQAARDDLAEMRALAEAYQDELERLRRPRAPIVIYAALAAIMICLGMIGLEQGTRAAARFGRRPPRGHVQRALPAPPPADGAVSRTFTAIGPALADCLRFAPHAGELHLTVTTDGSGTVVSVAVAEQIVGPARACVEARVRNTWFPTVPAGAPLRYEYPPSTGPF